MFKLSTGLVVLSLFAAGPAFAQAPAAAPATPTKPIVNTIKEPAAKEAVKETVDKAKSATEAGKEKAAETAKHAVNTTQIDINSASVETLATLRGIGPVRAEAIVKGRPYKGKDDLIAKKVIPEAVYKEIKDQIVAKQK